MESYDHHPWGDYDTLRAAHAQLIADIAGMLISVPLPGSTPARDAPALPTPPPSRFVKKGFYMCCADCGMAVEFCGCAKTPPPPTQGDGESSDLNRRIKDWKGR